MNRPLGVILAGGQATRMGGGDKGVLTLGGKSLLTRVIDRFAPQVPALALNANGDPDRFAEYHLPVIADTIADYPGPLAGVLAGLDWAAEQGADTIVTAAADTPFFPTNLTKRFLEVSRGQALPLVLAASPRGQETTKSMSRSGLIRHPTFGLWPVALRDDLRRALEGGLKKVVLWTDRHGGREAQFENAEGDPFFNVNTPEDLTRAEEFLR